MTTDIVPVIIGEVMPDEILPPTTQIDSQGSVWIPYTDAEVEDGTAQRDYEEN